eukprot:222985_1
MSAMQRYVFAEEHKETDKLVFPPKFGACKHYASMFRLIESHDHKHAEDDGESCDLSYDYKIDNWIDRNPELIKVITPYLKSQPFKDISVLFIHHLTDTIGTVSSIRQLGCTDLTAIYIGYNDDAEKAYFPDFDDLPRNEFKAFTLRPHDNQDDDNYVELSPGGCQYDDKINFPFDEFNKIMRENKMGFLEGIRSLSSYILLNYSKEKKFLIIEDGGYISPILNDEAFNKLSVANYCKKHNIPLPSVNNDLTMDAFLDKYMVGSIEHTRNGYDRLKEVEVKHRGALYKPNFSIACSYVKTQIESESVSASVLNAATNVLYALGRVMLLRNIVVFGCRGNIGRYIMEQLETRVKDPKTQIIGCDLKVNSAFASKYFPDGDKLKPKWLISATEPSTAVSKEIETFDDLSLEDRLKIDTIIGTTGGASEKYKTFSADHLIVWLCRSPKKDLFFISASTKKLEFKQILEWIEANDDGENKSILNKDDDEQYLMKISSDDIIDDNSQRRYGIHYTITINNRIVKHLYFFNDGMPINFLFYGVPNEYLDMIMTQLIHISILLANKGDDKAISNRIYLVDYDPECTSAVYKAVYQDIEPIKHPIKYSESNNT